MPQIQQQQQLETITNCFLPCVLEVFSKYAWAIPLEGKKGEVITKSSQKIVKVSNLKPNKICLDEGSEFYKRSMNSWLEDNKIEIYSTHREEKSGVTEQFIETLSNKIYKYMTAISKKCKYRKSI